MRPANSIATCAVAALAMVFSVQQGEHGPLVVYKLAVPKVTVPAPSPPAPPLVVPAKRSPAKAQPRRATGQIQRLSPLKPTIIGTVVMPAPRQMVVPAAPPMPITLPLPIPLAAPPLAAPKTSVRPAAVYRIVPDAAPSDARLDAHLVNEETGETLTLDAVTEAVEWRRDTAERLNTTPGAFGF